LRQVSAEAGEAKKDVVALRAELEARKANHAKVENEAANKEKALIGELEECQSFILRISKSCFY